MLSEQSVHLHYVTTDIEVEQSQIGLLMTYYEANHCISRQKQM